MFVCKEIGSASQSMAEEDELTAALQAELTAQAAQHGISNFRRPAEAVESLPEEAREELEEELATSNAELGMFAGLRPSSQVGHNHTHSDRDRTNIATDEEEKMQREARQRDPLRRARLEDFEQPEDLEELGLELLKEELEIRGMKCGGTCSERAARLWLARGVEDLATLPKSAMAKKGSTAAKKRKRDGSCGGESGDRGGAVAPSKPPRKATAGPLMPGVYRRPGQKSLPRGV